MLSVVDKALKYLEKVLDIDLETMKWPNADSLKLYLRKRYEYFEIKIAGQNVLLLCHTNEQYVTPGEIRADCAEIKKIYSGITVYVTESIKPYNRDRMIKQRIQFLIPGNQLYVPELGCDLREYYLSRRESTRNAIAPASQCIVMHYLNKTDADNAKFEINELSRALGYSKMTISRSISELVNSNIVKTRRNGKAITMQFLLQKSELWKNKRHMLQNPVKKIVWVKRNNHKFQNRSGLSALSALTNYGEPEFETYAVKMKEWRSYKSLHDLIEIENNDNESHKIELWSYAPDLFSQDGCVDKYSLYLSLINDNDERAAIELDKLLRESL